MKKIKILLFAAALILSLTACGNSSASVLQQENRALQEQIETLEAENEALTQENENLKAENAALDDTAPESGDEESNPIDRFFDGVDIGSSTAEMDAVADSWADAWEAECRNAAEWLKDQLPRQDEKDLVDGYIASAEEQIRRMEAMAIWPISDLTLPLEEQAGSSGSLRGVLWAGSYNQVWKDTFYQLLYVSPTYAGGIDSATAYHFVFDPAAAQAELSQSEY